MTFSQLVVSEVFFLAKGRSLDTFRPDETCLGICAALHPFFDTTDLLSQAPRPKSPFASRSALASMSRCTTSQWPFSAAILRGVQPRGGSIRSRPRGVERKRVKCLSLKTFRISTECPATHNCFKAVAQTESKSNINIAAFFACYNRPTS